MEASGSGSGSEAALEALGLSPQLFLNEVRNVVDDVLDEAFHFGLQQAQEVVGAAAAGEKGEELERGVSSLHQLVKAVLDKRMGGWESYCLQHCFAVPEGFTVPKDVYSYSESTFFVQVKLLKLAPQVFYLSVLATLRSFAFVFPNDCSGNIENNSFAEVLWHKEGHSDSELDTELDSLRIKLKSAEKEFIELQKEISSLERHTKFSSDFDASVAETLKLFDENSVQQTFQDIVRMIPKLHKRMLEMKRKRAESMLNQKAGNTNSITECKRATLDKGFTARIEDIHEVISILEQE